MKDNKNVVILLLFALFAFLIMKNKSSGYGCCGMAA